MGEIHGVMLLSPPLHRTTDVELEAWAEVSIPVVALVPEFDDYLPPPAARQRFALAPNIEIVAAEGAKHLLVGEKQTTFVLSEITKRLNPSSIPLPDMWPV